MNHPAQATALTVEIVTSIALASIPTKRHSGFWSKTPAIHTTSTVTVTGWRARNYYPETLEAAKARRQYLLRPVVFNPTAQSSDKISRPMKLLAMTLAGAILTGIIALELWHLSGQRFWLFCALLLLVGEFVFLSARLLGDGDATRVLGWRFNGFSDWATASISVAAIVLGLIACSVLIYQLAFFAPVGACGEICRP